MPDEKSPSKEQAPVEAVAVSEAALKSKVSTTVALIFVILALLGVFSATWFKNRVSQRVVNPAELSTLQAQANALRSEYNNERSAMGLRPIESDSESLEDLSARVKKDTNALIALAVTYQKMLGEKDSELTAKNLDALRAENLRLGLANENTRLQAELKRTSVGDSDTELLQRDLESAKNQRDALAAELATARQKIDSMATTATADDVADLKRRLEETLRAKEFFEARAKTLEAESSKAK
jgi:hypothetical protein